MDYFALQAAFDAQSFNLMDINCDNLTGFPIPTPFSLFTAQSLPHPPYFRDDGPDDMGDEEHFD